MSRYYAPYGYFLIGFLFFFSCGQAGEKSVGTVEQDERSAAVVEGNYVSDGYDLRDQGYDWVAVLVSASDEDEISIRVRSRADKKRPTCTFDGIAYRRMGNTYAMNIDGGEIDLRFEEDTLRIIPRSPEDASKLYFYCSGGATFAGKYARIDGKPDESQIDPTIFSKYLSLQDVGFAVSSRDENGNRMVSIRTNGLEGSNFNETFVIDGHITGMEVEDMNGDEHPELLIYTQTNDESRSGDVLAFSVNNGLSLTEAYLNPLSYYPGAERGYDGHDAFTLVETNLVRRFPIFKDAGGKKIRTDSMREVYYELREGEAMRQLEITNIREYKRTD